jgi:tRNA(Ile)-lysidine synthase
MGVARVTGGGEPAAAFAAAMASAFEGLPPPALLLAVSGGGDSMALLHLAADWACGRGTALAVATVDHGLRAEAAGEAALVARAAAARGLPHDVLRWRWDGAGNLQAAAREARFRLLAEAARARGAGAVLLAHTLDDQAETVLMRLARGSGVDGLAGMGAARDVHGVRFLRPLLGVRRAGLRALLAARGGAWAEDASNADLRYDRVRARAALEALAPLGLDACGLAETAARMAEARAALGTAARALAAPHLRVEAGDVLLPVAVLAGAPAELRHRLLAHLLSVRAGRAYRPRYRPLRALACAVLAGRGGVLHGCRVTVTRGVMRVTREHAAVAGAQVPLAALAGGPWDGIWRLDGPAGAGADLTVGALGPAGLADLPRPVADLPRATLMASPAIRRGGRLVAAPLAAPRDDWRAEPLLDAAGCLRGLDSD